MAVHPAIQSTTSTSDTQPLRVDKWKLTKQTQIVETIQPVRWRWRVIETCRVRRTTRSEGSQQSCHGHSLWIEPCESSRGLSSIGTERASVGDPWGGGARATAQHAAPASPDVPPARGRRLHCDSLLLA